MEIAEIKVDTPTEKVDRNDRLSQEVGQLHFAIRPLRLAVERRDERHEHLAAAHRLVQCVLPVGSRSDLVHVLEKNLSLDTFLNY